MSVGVLSLETRKIEKKIKNKNESSKLEFFLRLWVSFRDGQGQEKTIRVTQRKSKQFVPVFSLLFCFSRLCASCFCVCIVFFVHFVHSLSFVLLSCLRNAFSRKKKEKKKKKTQLFFCANEGFRKRRCELRLRWWTETETERSASKS